MIYINDELQKSKPEDLLKEFKREFTSFLDDKRERLVKPVKIKYIPSLIKADPKNKGKFIKPRSLDIRHVSQVQIGDSMADVRYTKTAPRKDPHGALEFKEVSTDVVGQIVTTDIDLLFFFWAYSHQNVKNNPDAKLTIENKEREIELEAKAKRSEARIQAMLWNEERFGGVSIEKLTEYARTTKTVTGVDEMSEDELRNSIARDFTLDRFAKNKFLDFMFVAKEDYQETKPKYDIIGKALEANVIAQVNSKQIYSFVNSEGKPEGEIWTWKNTPGFDKPPVKFYNWLKEFEPAILEKIESMTKEVLETA